MVAGADLRHDGAFKPISGAVYFGTAAHQPAHSPSRVHTESDSNRHARRLLAYHYRCVIGAHS